jgi:phosphoribosylformimino-5-aminoimidazole carboxamide ribotide isomerase
MEVIPAIDLKDGACVRLYQGDFQKETVFSRDPAEMARRWESEGAARLHVVDLNGSRDGHMVNLEAVKTIVASVKVPVQVGGGIRSLESAQSLVESGVDRVVVGTAAVENPGLVEILCKSLGSGRVVVAVDAKGGKVAIKGWQERTDVNTVDLAMEMIERGAQRFLFTDIARDGTMMSPNFEGVSELVRRTGKAVLASGGVSTVEDIRMLGPTGAEGVVVGSALYRGMMELRDAIRAAKP